MDDIQKVFNRDVFKDCVIKELKGTKKRKDYKVSCPDRNRTRDSLVEMFQQENIEHSLLLTSKSSVPVLDLTLDESYHRFIFKPKSGGLGESTLNSTITELVPCILFETDIKFEHFGDLQEKLINLDHTKLGCYVNCRDAMAGHEFIKELDLSSKFEEKMMNAMAILKYLQHLDSLNPIQQVYWAYRAKPAGIPGDSPADIIVKYEDDTMIGISLKSGKNYTDEPLLNTYVKTIYEFYNKDTQELVDKLYDMTYSKLGLDKDYMSDRAKTYDILQEFEEHNLDSYNQFYDQGVAFIKDKIADLFKDKKIFKNFVKRKILKKSHIPTVTIKAIKDTWKEVEDISELENVISNMINIDITMMNAKQDMRVSIFDKHKNKTDLMFRIRTNKSGVRHKLGQFYNLAVKFHGIIK